MRFWPGSGIRIGEALGLGSEAPFRRLPNHNHRAIVLARRYTEAENQSRHIDKWTFATELANLLKAFVGERGSGFLFANRTGSTASQTTLLVAVLCIRFSLKKMWSSEDGLPCDASVSHHMA